MKKRFMSLFSYRLLNFYCFLLAVFLIGAAAYLQQVVGLEPCSLCVIQRMLVVVLGILFFGGMFHEPLPFWRKIYGGIILVVSLLGVAVAWRHVWLEHLPPEQMPACVPGLKYIINNLPLKDALQVIFQGSAECIKSNWSFLSLSIAEWTLLFFIFFAIIALIQMFRTRVKPR